MTTYWKPSRYNFFIPEQDRDDVLLFNGLHTALLRLPPAVYPIAAQVLSANRLDLSALPPEARSTFATLRTGKFLIGSDVDELAEIRARLKQVREGGPLHLVMAPTFECNLACRYCYQFRSSDRMSIEVCDRIILFVREQLQESDIHSMRVDWYGGEPLLAPEIIAYLSRRLLELTQAFGCDYEATIATNGTLLSNTTIGMLIENQIKSCQVTLDGPKAIHDVRRPFRNHPHSSFDQIIRNMRQVIGKCDLTVRINVDADNLLDAYAVLDLFQAEGFFRQTYTKFHPYIARVSQINPNKALRCATIDNAAFYKYSLEFQKKYWRIPLKTDCGICLISPIRSMQRAARCERTPSRLIPGVFISNAPWRSASREKSAGMSMAPSNFRCLKDGTDSIRWRTNSAWNATIFHSAWAIVPKSNSRRIAGPVMTGVIIGKEIWKKSSGSMSMRREDQGHFRTFRI